MAQASPELKRAKDNLLKELIRTSPKRFQAIVVDDDSSSSSDDDSEPMICEKRRKARNLGFQPRAACVSKGKVTACESPVRCGRKWRKPSPARALLFSSSDESDSESYTEFTSTTASSTTQSSSSSSPAPKEKRVCPKCSKVLSSSSELSSSCSYESSSCDSSSCTYSSESYSCSSDDDSDFEPRITKVGNYGPSPIFKYFTALGSPKRTPYIENQLMKRGLEENRKAREPIRSPQVIISPRKPSPMLRSMVGKHSRIEDILCKRQEKLKAEQEAERKRIEEEALAKAKAEAEKARKEQVQKILDSIRAKQQNPRRYVAVYFNPKRRHHYSDDSECDDSDSESCSYATGCSDSESCEDESSTCYSYTKSYSSRHSYTDDESDDELNEELGRLSKIAGKITKYGKKIKHMTNTSLSPKKHGRK